MYESLDLTRRYVFALQRRLRHGAVVRKVLTAITSVHLRMIRFTGGPGHPVCWSRAQAGNGEGWRALWPSNTAFGLPRGSSHSTGAEDHFFYLQFGVVELDLWRWEKAPPCPLRLPSCPISQGGHEASRGPPPSSVGWLWLLRNGSAGHSSEWNVIQVSLQLVQVRVTGSGWPD